MTKDELERIKQAYYSGLDIQIWFNGYWEDFDIRDYSMFPEPFSENRQYRIVGSAYADIAEERIAELEEKISVLLSCKNCPENKGGYICEKEYENKCLTQKIQFIKELQEEIAELKSKYDTCLRENTGLKIHNAYVEKKLNKATEILKVVLNKWKEERWILQSEKEVKMIENVMERARQFLKED